MFSIVNNRMCYKKNICYIALFFVFIYLFSLSSYSYSIQHNNDIFYRLEDQCTSAAVVDAKNGEILYSYNIDKQIFPASLTKIMTAYVIFDAINKGIVGMNDDVEIISKLAKDYSIDKRVTIEDLIYKMIVRSSNIASDILAKEIYGNVDKFISKMNYFAKKIGMKNTNFVNTNGLPNKYNYSTARDIVKLSIRLVYDFPQYADVFGITNYIDENSNYNTKTSSIQDNVIGLEGNKTGYINASGYNLCAWGKYGDKHLFIILIGAKDRQSRDKFVIELINSYSDNSDFKEETGIYYTSFFKKILDFIGIEYNLYSSPKPIERIEK